MKRLTRADWLCYAAMFAFWLFVMFFVEAR